MARTQLSSRLGADQGIYDHDLPVNVKRSSFPLSQKADFHLDAGPIVPFYLVETLPGDTFEISVQYLLKSFPMVVAPFTSYRVRTHFYYSKLSDLWKGAQTLLTKGANQSIELSVPEIYPYDNDPVFPVGSENFSSDAWLAYSAPQSLSSYFDFQPRGFNTIKEVDTGYNQPYSQCWYNTGSSTFSPYLKMHPVSVLPFMMYQKVYRSAYVVPNLLQSNKCWFPDDLTDGWRIDYNPSNNFFRHYFNPNGLPSKNTSDYYWYTGATNKIRPSAPSPSVDDQYVNLLQLRYALFEDDRFTTAIPSALRGDAPVVDVSSSDVHINNTDVYWIPTGSGPDYGHAKAINHINYAASANGYLYFRAGNVPASTQYSLASSDIYGGEESMNPGKLGLRNDSVTVNGLQFTANQLREMLSLSVWQERNERIQAGDYNQFIYAHFRHDPKSDDHEPIYLGGTSDVITFGDVVQTSETTANSPLGSTAGLGSSQGGAQVCRFTCSDYGYIMGVMIIQPETIYSQNNQKLWYRKQQEDFYFPEMEGLGLEEILNREIYPTDDASDVALWGYNERNTEYKAMANRARGFFAVNPDQDALGARDLAPYSQARIFPSRPQLSHQFLVMSPENMRRDAFAAPSMPQFRVSLSTQVHAIRPMSYRNIPNTFGF